MKHPPITSHTFHIARYERDSEGKFQLSHYDSFDLNYTQHPTRRNRLIVIVNGFRTKRFINIFERDEFKNVILNAISDYYNRPNEAFMYEYSKFFTSGMDKYFTKNARKIFKTQLFTLTKEDSRDKITKFNLLPKTQ